MSEFQMRREEKKDLMRNVKKRNKLGAANGNRATSYEPPMVDPMSRNVAKGNDECSTSRNDEFSPRWCSTLDAGSVKDKSHLQVVSSPDHPPTFDENGANGFNVCCSTQEMYHPSNILQTRNNMLNIARFDNESRRIIALMTPFTISAILDKLFEGIDIALISSRLGTDALAAYAIAGYFVG